MSDDPPLHGNKAGWTTPDIEAATGLPTRTTGVCIGALVARGLVESGTPFFVGGTFLPIQTSQTYYYRLQHNSGTTATALIECKGAKIIR